MKAHRLTTVAVVGVLLAGGLSACRADPMVAAYVDQVQITEAEVDEVLASVNETLSAEVAQGLDQLQESLAEQVGEDFTQAEADEQYAELAEAQQTRLDEQLSSLRTRVVEMRIFTEAGRQYAEGEGIEVSAADPQLHAEDVGLPADHPYVAVVADFRTVLGTLQGTIEPQEPTEADQREVYDNLISEGHTEVSFAEAQRELTVELIGEPVATRNLLREIIERADVTVNPRYNLTYRIPVPIGGVAESWLSVPLGDPAVIDAG